MPWHFLPFHPQPLGLVNYARNGMIAHMVIPSGQVVYHHLTFATCRVSQQENPVTSPARTHWAQVRILSSTLIPPRCSSTPIFSRPNPCVIGHDQRYDLLTLCRTGFAILFKNNLVAIYLNHLAFRLNTMPFSVDIAQHGRYLKIVVTRISGSISITVTFVPKLL